MPSHSLSGWWMFHQSLSIRAVSSDTEPGNHVRIAAGLAASRRTHGDDR